jgi:site-specific recombinase XerD
MNIQHALHQFCEYSQFIRGYSKSTIARYRSTIGFFIKTARVNDVSEVTDQVVRQFLWFGRTQRNWQASSFITYHKSLAVFFRWCISQGYLQGENPADGIEMPKLEKKLPPKLNQDEAMRILETAMNFPYKYKFLRYRNHAIFSVFLFAGLRKGELLGLKFTDVDLENRTIFVRQGKGSKDRIVPMSGTLAASLRTYLGERQRLNKTCPEFFASLNRNVGFTDIGLRRLIRKLKSASGVNFSAHKLRHSFATMMLEGGCDIYSLSRMLGHSDIKTTTIYLAATAEHLRGEMRKHPLECVGNVNVSKQRERAENIAM